MENTSTNSSGQPKLEFAEGKKLSKDHIEEIEKHLDFKQDNIQDHYDNLAENYEEIY
jgi:cyclopropane fatty-acyl-phospholipid synthase-like methyltransferase